MGMRSGAASSSDCDACGPCSAGSAAPPPKATRARLRVLGHRQQSRIRAASARGHRDPQATGARPPCSLRPCSGWTAAPSGCPLPGSASRSDVTRGAARANGRQHRDVRGLPIEARLDDGAIEDQANDVLFRPGCGRTTRPSPL